MKLTDAAKTAAVAVGVSGAMEVAGMEGLGGISGALDDIVAAGNSASSSMTKFGDSVNTSNFSVQQGVHSYADYKNALYEVARNMNLSRDANYQFEQSIKDISSTTVASRKDLAAFYAGMSDNLSMLTVSQTELNKLTKVAAQEYGTNWRSAIGQVMSTAERMPQMMEVLLHPKNLGEFNRMMMEVSSRAGYSTAIAYQRLFERMHSGIDTSVTDLQKLNLEFADLQNKTSEFSLRLGEIFAPIALSSTQAAKNIIGLGNTITDVMQKVGKNPLAMTLFGGAGGALAGSMIGGPVGGAVGGILGATSGGTGGLPSALPAIAQYAGVILGTRFLSGRLSGYLNKGPEGQTEAERVAATKARTSEISKVMEDLRFTSSSTTRSATEEGIVSGLKKTQTYSTKDISNALTSLKAQSSTLTKDITTLRQVFHDQPNRSAEVEGRLLEKRAALEEKITTLTEAQGETSGWKGRLSGALPKITAGIALASMAIGEYSRAQSAAMQGNANYGMSVGTGVLSGAFTGGMVGSAFGGPYGIAAGAALGAATGGVTAALGTLTGELQKATGSLAKLDDALQNIQPGLRGGSPGDRHAQSLQSQLQSLDDQAASLRQQAGSISGETWGDSAKWKLWNNDLRKFIFQYFSGPLTAGLEYVKWKPEFAKGKNPMEKANEDAAKMLGQAEDIGARKRELLYYDRLYQSTGYEIKNLQKANPKVDWGRLLGQYDLQRGSSQYNIEQIQYNVSALQSTAQAMRTFGASEQTVRQETIKQLPELQKQLTTIIQLRDNYKQLTSSMPFSPETTQELSRLTEEVNRYSAAVFEVQKLQYEYVESPLTAKYKTQLQHGQTMLETRGAQWQERLPGYQEQARVAQVELQRADHQIRMARSMGWDKDPLKINWWKEQLEKRNQLEEVYMQRRMKALEVHFSGEWELYKKGLNATQNLVRILPTTIGEQYEVAKKSYEVSLTEQAFYINEYNERLKQHIKPTDEIMLQLTENINNSTTEIAQKYMEMTGGISGQIEATLGELTSLPSDIAEFAPRLAEQAGMMRNSPFAPAWKYGDFGQGTEIVQRGLDGFIGPVTKSDSEMLGAKGEADMAKNFADEVSNKVLQVNIVGGLDGFERRFSR